MKKQLSGVSVGHRAVMEAVEARRMLAAAPAYRPVWNFTDGVLRVIAADPADTLVAGVRRNRLAFEAQASGRSYGDLTASPAYAEGLVFSDADRSWPKLATVKKIVIDLGDGDDTVDLRALSVPAEVFGGAGRDRIVGTAVGDTLHGGTGADRLYDGGKAFYVRGNDLLNGGGGSDRMIAFGGADTIIGGWGNDHLSNFSNDQGTLDGGLGTDTGEFGVAPEDQARIEQWGVDSTYVPTEQRVVPISLVQLRRDADGSYLLDATLIFDDGGWDFDWDLLPGDPSGLKLRATIYQANFTTDYALSPQEYTETFNLGRFPAGEDIDATSLRLDVVTDRTRLQNVTFEIDDDFVTQSFRRGRAGNSSNL